MTKTAIVARPETVGELRRILEAGPVLAELQKAMPPGLSPKRLVRQCMSLVQRTPRLLQCTSISMLSGLMQAAELGLELTGPLGHAYLIPRKIKATGEMTATFQLGYKGLIALAYRSPALGSLTARHVREADEFEVALGTENRLHHRIARGERGPIVSYYACAFFLRGGHDFEVWSRADAEAHRDRYAASRGDDSAWKTAFDAMGLKSVIAALCRRLSLCPEAQAAVGAEEEAAAAADRGETPSRTQEVLAQLEASFGTAEEAPPGDSAGA